MNTPAWFQRAREIAARAGKPAPFYAKRANKTFELRLYDAIGLDPWTGGGIDPTSVVKALDENRDASDLVVRISSPGGSVFDGLTIYNAIRSFKGTKTVHVDGIAASIASVIALAGDRVVTNDGAMWMVHDPWGGLFAMGSADQIEDEARKTVSALRKVRENLVDIYTRQTGKPVATVSGWMTAETWMTADEALANGLTDEIVKDEAPKAHSQEAAGLLAAMTMELRAMGARGSSKAR